MNFGRLSFGRLIGGSGGTAPAPSGYTFLSVKDASGVYRELSVKLPTGEYSNLIVKVPQ